MYGKLSVRKARATNEDMMVSTRYSYSGVAAKALGAYGRGANAVLGDEGCQGASQRK